MYYTGGVTRWYQVCTRVLHEWYRACTRVCTGLLTTWHIQPPRELRRLTTWHIQPPRHLGINGGMWHKQPLRHLGVEEENVAQTASQTPRDREGYPPSIPGMYHLVPIRVHTTLYTTLYTPGYTCCTSCLLLAHACGAERCLTEPWAQQCETAWVAGPGG